MWDHVFVECGSPRIGYAGIYISFAAFLLGSLTCLPTSFHFLETILASKYGPGTDRRVQQSQSPHRGALPQLSVVGW